MVRLLSRHVAVATIAATLLTLTAWSSVSYPGSPDALQGRSVKPAIGPPISHA